MILKGHHSSNHERPLAISIKDLFIKKMQILATTVSVEILPPFDEN